MERIVLKVSQNAVYFDGAPAHHDLSGNAEMETAHNYDVWLSRGTPMARWMRFWLAPQRTVWLNTPVRWLQEALSLQPSSRVLDIGCGYGGILLYLRRRAGITETLDGLDCSRLMVERGRKEMQRRGLQDAITLKQGVATALPYPDASRDVVVCTYVIKHLPDPLLRQMLLEIRRVLKPGGRLCLWEAGPSRYPFMQVWNMKLLRTGWAAPVYLRTLEELRNRLDEAGFADIRPYGNGFYYYYPPLPRVGFIASNPGG